MANSIARARLANAMQSELEKAFPPAGDASKHLELVERLVALVQRECPRCADVPTTEMVSLRRVERQTLIRTAAQLASGCYPDPANHEIVAQRTVAFARVLISAVDDLNIDRHATARARDARADWSAFQAGAEHGRKHEAARRRHLELGKDESTASCDATSDAGCEFDVYDAWRRKYATSEAR